MTAASPSGRGRRGPGWWWVLTVGLVLVAATSVVVGWDGPGTRTEVSSSRASRPETTLPVSSSVARSVPVALSIPAIGVSVSVSVLGLNPDRTVEVPSDFGRPGWFRLGPTPGQLGSAVILGHVDSFRGPAVFFRLRHLLPGDGVEVALADGGVARFAVDRVMTYPKEQFPAEQVYGSHGASELQLVTCGGEFDPRTRSYLSNVVVYTSLVGVVPAG